MQPGHLAVPTKIILAVQASLAVVAGIISFASSSTSDGWGDLVKVAVGLLVVTYLLGAATAWVLARFAIRHPVVQALIAVSLPPLFVVIAIVIVRSA
jgi:amino acid transporter